MIHKLIKSSRWCLLVIAYSYSLLVLAQSDVPPEGDVFGKYQLVYHSDGETPPSFVFQQFGISPHVNYLYSEDIVGGRSTGFVGSRSIESSVLVDGVERVAEGTGEWAIPFEDIVQEGENTIAVSWVNSEGTVLHNQTYIVYQDTSFPEIVSITPAPYQVLTEQFSTFDINLAEQGSGLDASQIYVSLFETTGENSYSCDSSSSSSQSCSVIYDEVQNTIQVVFTTPLDELTNYTFELELQDNAGNARIYDYQYYIDSNYTEVPGEQGTVGNNWQVSPEINYVNGSTTLDVFGTRPPFTTVILNDIQLLDTGVGNWESQRHNLLSPGENVLLFKWQESSGSLVNSIEYRLFYDNVKPVVTPVSPELGAQFVGDLTEMVFAVVEDSGVDLIASSFELQQNGSTVMNCQGVDSAQACWLEMMQSGNLVVKFQSPIENGDYDTNVTVIDKSGNSKILTDSLSVSDTVTLNLGAWQTVPEENYVRNTSDVPYTVSGTRFSNSSVTLNGEEIVVQGSGAWSFDLRNAVDIDQRFLQEGVNTLQFSWLDEHGTSLQTFDYNVLYDVLGPVISTVEPSQETIIRENITQFTVLFDHRGSGIKLVEVPFYNSGASYVTLNNQEGQTISCGSTDSTKPCWLSYDESQPGLLQVNLQAPLGDYEWYVTVNLRDNGNGYNTSKGSNLYFYYYINTSGELVPVGEIDSFIPFPETNYIFNESQRIWGSRAPGTAVTINGEEQVSVGVGRWHYDYVFSDGENILDIQWKNASGDSSEELRYRIFLDKTDPELTIISPLPDSVQVNEITQIQMQVTDTGSGINPETVSFDIYDSLGNISIYCEVGSTECPLSYDDTTGMVVASIPQGLGDESWTIDGYLQDNSGNGISIDYQFIVQADDTFVPVGSISSSLQDPPASNLINGNAYNNNSLGGSRRDATAVSINGVQRVALGSGNWSIPYSEILSEGESTIAIQWEDENGYTSDELTYKFTVDTVAPAIVSTLPVDGGEYDEISSLELSIVEEGTGIDGTDANASNVSVYRNSVKLFDCRTYHNADSCRLLINNSTATITMPYVLTAIGQYDLTVKFRDIAGNALEDNNLQDTVLRYTVTGNSDQAPAAPTINAYESSVEQAYIQLSGTKAANSYIVVNGEQLEKIIGEPTNSFEATTWSKQVPLEEG
ncbi:MAG: Ig-like domain repeat protein, partial [Arenicella sp.]